MKKNFEILIDAIADKGIRAEEITVWKNGKEYPAFVFGDGNVKPNITVEKLQQMIEGYGFEKAVELIIDSVQNAPNGDCIADKANDINYLCDNAILCVQRASNEHITKKIVKGDLEAYIRVKMGESDDEIHTAKVTEVMAHTFSEEEMARLWKSAEDNLRANLFTCDMGRMFGGTPNEMVIISTNDTFYGAGFIALEDVLKDVAEQYNLGSDVWLLPSSIHELIMLKADSRDAEELNAMVKDINASKVPDDIVLSEHAYRFTF